MKPIILLLSSLPLMAQFSSTAYHIAPGASLPATCNPANGDVYFKTSATIAVYYCSATNTWSLISAGGGSVAGSGSANQVAYWSSASAITGSSGLTYDGSALTIGTTISLSSTGNPLIQIDGSANSSFAPFLSIKSDGGDAGIIQQSGSTFSSNQGFDDLNSNLAIEATGPGGLSLVADNAAPIHLVAGGALLTDEVMRINPGGVIGIGPFPSLTTMDLGLYRKSAGLLQVNTGTVDSLAAIEVASCTGCGGQSPGSTSGAVQFNTASAFAGDVNNFEYFSSTTAPVAPVLAVVGTPGMINYGYQLVYRTPTGTSSNSLQATVVTGNAVLDGTNYITVTAPSCAQANTTVDVYLTTTDVMSNVPTPGFLANIACGDTYNHQGQDGNGVSPAGFDSTQGLYIYNMVVGSNVTLSGLAGTGNLPACLDANGKLFAGSNTAGVLSCP